MTPIQQIRNKYFSDADTLMMAEDALGCARAALAEGVDPTLSKAIIGDMQEHTAWLQACHVIETARRKQ